MAKKKVIALISEYLCDGLSEGHGKIFVLKSIDMTTISMHIKLSHLVQQKL